MLPLDPMFGNMINTLRDSFSTRPTLLISQHAFASAKGKVSQEEKPQCQTDKLSCGSGLAFCGFAETLCRSELYVQMLVWLCRFQ